MDEIMQAARRFQRYADGLQALMVDAQSRAPARTEGEDSSGAIRVVLGPAGAPLSIRVAEDWTHKVAPQRFDHAVTEAFEAAMSRCLTTWTRALEDAGWQAKVDRLQADFDDQQDAGPTSGELPAAFRGDAPKVRPRPLDEIAEDMIGAFDRLEAGAAPLSRTATGSAAEGRLTVTLTSTGFESSTADPRWLADQSGTALTTAFGHALTQARTELERLAESRAPGSPLAMNGLLDEAFAVLSDPNRSSQGSRAR